jgi:methyl coenzyme M reductase alpha subunit
MSALTSFVATEMLLYGLLAYAAAANAMSERLVGHKRSSVHHGMAAVAYALLAAVHLVHS